MGDPHDGSRQDRDAIFYADRDKGRREDAVERRYARTPSADSSFQHVSSLTPPWTRGNEASRWPAQAHGMGRADSDGLGRLPGVQSLGSKALRQRWIRLWRKQNE